MTRGIRASAVALFVALAGCGDDAGGGDSAASGGGGRAGAGGFGSGGGSGGSSPIEPPPASCEASAGGGEKAVAEPEIALLLADRWEEGWLGSPAVADLDGDGDREIVVPRDGALVVWNADGSLAWKHEEAPGRIWASPVVADLAGDAKLEVAFASRDTLFVVDHAGKAVSGFPVAWEDEMRAIAAGDVDGDGDLEILAAPAHGGPADVMNAFRGDGSQAPGFPPNAAGVSGCEVDDACYLAGCYDQNLAVGDLDGDGKHDVVAPHDNAYASIHSGSGAAFDAAPGYSAKKTPGIRYLHDLASAKQGYAEDEESALQGHFTNTAPAIADLDGDGTAEVVMVGSVQNASQSDREKGVALWVVRKDASRLEGWEQPHHVPDYLSGLEDYGDNMVGITNQVTVADIHPDEAGPELLFAGFDGRIHAVSAARKPLWSVVYTSDPDVATGGVAVADLSGDGSPEVVFSTYSLSEGKGALFVLDSGGNTQHEIPLPRRGAMAVPTIADVDGDGGLEILVSLKDAEDKVESVLVYRVPGSSDNCLLWPTGRANYLRDGWVN